MTNQLFTLITGAGQGIGYAFAEACAIRGMNLVLVSLPGEGLRERAVALQAEYAEVLYRNIEIQQIAEHPDEDKK